jgi:hypothetical protein
MKAAFYVLLLLLAAYAAAMYVPFEPDERRPGGRLGGPVSLSAPLPWEGQKKIYVETRTWYRVPHSVTTIAWTRDGTIYVPCGACSGKRWPKNVAREPVVRLKIDGRLYERRAVPVSDPEEVRWVLDTPLTEDLPGDLVLYRMERLRD